MITSSGLGRFLGFYESLEHFVSTFRRGASSASPYHHAAIARLANDLSELGADPYEVGRTPAAVLPDLPTFAHGPRTPYASEGATLSRRLKARLVVPIGIALSRWQGQGGRSDANNLPRRVGRLRARSTAFLRRRRNRSEARLPSYVVLVRFFCAAE
jgi:hypothetical protein